MEQAWSDSSPVRNLPSFAEAVLQGFESGRSGLRNGSVSSRSVSRRNILPALGLCSLLRVAPLELRETQSGQLPKWVLPTRVALAETCFPWAHPHS